MSIKFKVAFPFVDNLIVNVDVYSSLVPSSCHA